MDVTDACGTPMGLPPVGRVVSLVGSLTETIAYVDPQLLVAITDWCDRPAAVAATTIGGPKNPDLDVICALKPDVVLASQTENKQEHIEQLRARGLAVYVLAPSTVDRALQQVESMLIDLGLEPSDWISLAARELARPVPELLGLRAVCFTRRSPWMAVGGNTFVGDMLARLGIINVLANRKESNPRVDHRDVSRGVDLVVLPDTPYRFSAVDGPEEFSGSRCALVSGRHLSWYGPSMLEARAVLAPTLIGPVRAL